VARIAGKVRGILLLDGLNMVNNHFLDDSLFSVRDEQESVDGALTCLDTFCVASGAMVSVHKTNFWIIGLDSSPKWILDA
jgi:hypothetical protein